MNPGAALPAEKLYFSGHSKKYPHLPLALDGLGLYHLQEHIDRPAGMDFWQWVQCISGSGTLLVDDKSYLVTPGSGILIPPECGHIYYSNGEPWYVNFLCCGGALITAFTEQLHLNQPGVYQLPHPEKILEYENDIVSLYRQNRMDTPLQISKLLYSLLMDLSQDIRQSKAGQSLPRNEKVHQAICFMQRHFSNNIGLDDIAADVGLSKEYLCQIFKQHTDSTLLEHLTEIRISEAKMLLLKHPDKTIREIAALCGFDSPSYFCSVFKKHEHMTPLQFAHGR